MCVLSTDVIDLNCCSSVFMMMLMMFWTEIRKGSDVRVKLRDRQTHTHTGV